MSANAATKAVLPLAPSRVVLRSIARLRVKQPVRPITRELLWEDCRALAPFEGKSKRYFKKVVHSLQRNKAVTTKPVRTPTETEEGTSNKKKNKKSAKLASKSFQYLLTNVGRKQVSTGVGRGKYRFDHMTLSLVENADHAELLNVHEAFLKSDAEVGEVVESADKQ